MKACLLLLLVCLVMLTSAVGSATIGWGSLKPGMTPKEVSATLGNPLLSSAGHGFEIWIYDNKSEVIFHGGMLMGWTVPAVTKPHNPLHP